MLVHTTEIHFRAESKTKPKILVVKSEIFEIFITEITSQKLAEIYKIKNWVPNPVLESLWLICIIRLISIHFFFDYYKNIKHNTWKYI